MKSILKLRRHARAFATVANPQAQVDTRFVKVSGNGLIWVQQGSGALWHL